MLPTELPTTKSQLYIFVQQALKAKTIKENK